jgi:hypothetical protein
LPQEFAGTKSAKFLTAATLEEIRFGYPLIEIVAASRRTGTRPRRHLRQEVTPARNRTDKND